jgi:flagellar export protein FliJ
MKRFKFSLQSVHDHRTIRREAAEGEFAESAAAVSDAAAMLEQSVLDRNAAIEAYMAILEGESVDPSEIALRAHHIALLVEREKERRARLKLLERARDAKRQAVISTTTDQKATANLRERHLARYEFAAERTEQTALDEMANMRFVRRSG